MTRQLNIRYLWVDSLCIIQGQNSEATNDWEVESQKMDQVLRNAYFTLMASGSPSAHDGLFPERREQDRFTEIPVISGDLGRSDVGYLGPDPSERSFFDEDLHRRGWVFQEAFLSTRALSFGSSELSWRCRSIERRETLIGGIEIEDESKPKSRIRTFLAVSTSRRLR